VQRSKQKIICIVCVDYLVMQGGVRFYGVRAAATATYGMGMRTCCFARFLVLLLLLLLRIGLTRFLIVV
jgi:hypothetical protein